MFGSKNQKTQQTETLESSVQNQDETKADLKQNPVTHSDHLETNNDNNKNNEEKSTVLNDVLKARELGEQYAAQAPNRDLIIAQLKGLSFEELKLRKKELSEQLESQKMIERHNAGELSEEETKQFVALLINISAVHQLILEKLDERFEARRLMAEEYEKQNIKRSYDNL